MPCLLATFVLTLAGLAGRAAAGPDPILENPSLRLAFEGATGALTEFDAKAPAQPFLDKNDPRPLWTIVPMEGPSLDPGSARSFSWRQVSQGASGLELTWSRFERAAVPDLKVVATVTLDAASPETRWRIRLEGLGGLAVRQVHFPCLGGIAPQEGETLAVPEWMGKRSGRPRTLFNPPGGAPGRREWAYPGMLSMQFLAWYGSSSQGLLLSTHDPSALRKRFAVFGDGKGGLAIEVVHQPSVDGQVEPVYEPPYDTLIDVVPGDWFAAAREYSRWSRDQSWVRESRLKQGKTPEWARETGLWVWNRGRSEGVLPPAQRLQEVSHLPVSVFWHWWHGCAYDTGFPEYLPPREGEQSFRNALEVARENGIHSLVYMNQRLWGMTTDSWTAEGAERFAVKGPEGKVAPEVYNIFTKAPCAAMCMGTSFWREKYAGLATQAFHLGVDGIYMDQACSSMSCYDPSHGHPLGGGTYWTEGFRNLEQLIRERCDGDRLVTLAGEGCGEAWLPRLDLMLSLQVSMERYGGPGEWEPIPLFQSVYHDCALLYGNYSSLTYPPYDDLWPAEFAPKEPLALLDRKFSAQFRMEQARSFVWGQQLTLANFTPALLADRKQEIDFLLELARLRSKTREFLQQGTMLAPLAFSPPAGEIPISRLSIYAGQQDQVKEYQGTVPLVHSGVWLAPEGRVGVALVNISEQPQTVSFSIRSEDYPISASGRVRWISPDGILEATGYSHGKATFDRNLPPASACLLELTPESAAR